MKIKIVLIVLDENKLHFVIIESTIKSISLLATPARFFTVSGFKIPFTAQK